LALTTFLFVDHSAADSQLKKSEQQNWKKNFKSASELRKQVFLDTTLENFRALIEGSMPLRKAVEVLNSTADVPDKWKDSIVEVSVKAELNEVIFSYKNEKISLVIEDLGWIGEDPVMRIKILNRHFFFNVNSNTLVAQPRRDAKKSQLTMPALLYIGLIDEAEAVPPAIALVALAGVVGPIVARIAVAATVEYFASLFKTNQDGIFDRTAARLGEQIKVKASHCGQIRTLYQACNSWKTFSKAPEAKPGSINQLANQSGETFCAIADLAQKIQTQFQLSLSAPKNGKSEKREVEVEVRSTRKQAQRACNIANQLEKGSSLETFSRACPSFS